MWPTSGREGEKWRAVVRRGGERGSEFHGRLAQGGEGGKQKASRKMEQERITGAATERTKEERGSGILGETSPEMY